MTDSIMATAGHTSSIHVIDAENQELKIMLMIFHHACLSWRPADVLPPVDQRDISIADQSAGAPVIKNIVGTTGVSNNVLRNAQNHVPSRRKTRTAVTRLTGWRHKGDQSVVSLG
ncbi:hypothetical protein NPIL_40341 [Nephila pilipes]|uniref:Uncharacterized protein n=1 Tax=Nephila pilipes TaxID=299642 RepID=A0A8X6PYR0_NEPPI|nr:hypothetical protein NPIL_40341 [Nephila pilipes]